MGKGDPQQAEGQDVLQSLLHADEPGRAREVETSSLFRQFRRVLQEMLREMQNMSAKEKSKFEDMAKSDKARYNWGMKNYVPPKGDEKGKKKDFSAPKRPPSAFFLFCSEHCPKIKSEHPGLSIRDTSEKLREMWSKQSAKDKQPYEQKAGKLKKYGNNTPAYRAKGKREAGKNSPGCPTGSKMNGPEDEEEEKEEEEDEDEEEDDEDQE